MNFTVITCCYVLLPYFASLVSPPQEAITCNAANIISGRHIQYILNLAKQVCFHSIPEGLSPEENPKVENLTKSFENLEYNYFEQRLDHYHFANLSKWSQRYLIYDRHYDGNGIIFLRIGTQLETTSQDMQNGRWFEYCRKTKALCIGIELRGYGKSLPNGNVKDENLKYLNSDQTLADVAWFIYNFRGLQPGYAFPEKLKWVVYGRSDRGTLAIRLRMKFPHLVDATLSLSAPLLAQDEFSDYFELIKSEMLDEEQQFKEKIQEAYEEIKKRIDKKKYEELGTLFSFCEKKILEKEKNRKKNIEYMYFTFAQTVAAIMQYGNDHLKCVKKEITKSMSNPGTEYQKYNSILRFAQLIKALSNNECLNIDYDKVIRSYKVNVNRENQMLSYPLPLALGERRTLYQYCNEYGNFETFKNFFDTTIDLSFFKKICYDVFGEQSPKGQLEKGVRRTNILYGGKYIVVSRVILVYASNDPYRKLGAIDNNLPDTKTFYLKGVRHCYEIDNVKNTKQSMNVKQVIYDQLMEWLQTPEYDGKIIMID